jgi:DnaD/phage-associated family protein
MPVFKGFTEGKAHLVPIPGGFFSDYLPLADDLDELKLALYVFWRTDRIEGAFRYLRIADFVDDAEQLRALGLAEAVLPAALGRAVAHGILLEGQVATPQGVERLYFINGPRGRAAIEAIQRGEWTGLDEQAAPRLIVAELPNIFRLYEENIGPLTPIIADELRAAEADYPTEWIAEAVKQAVQNNKRAWRYIAAILARWKEEGRHEQRKDRRDTEKTRRKYSDWESG